VDRLAESDVRVGRCQPRPLAEQEARASQRQIEHPGRHNGGNQEAGAVELERQHRGTWGKQALADLPRNVLHRDVSPRGFDQDNQRHQRNPKDGIEQHEVAGDGTLSQ